jgi:4'-phosphopantetheinyl transferase
MTLSHHPRPTPADCAPSGAEPLPWPLAAALPAGVRGPFPQLWRLDLGTAPGDASCLSPDECARRDRFVFPQHQRRHAAAHVLLRHLLAAAVGASPAALVFKAGPHGKPSLAEPAHAGGFNLSHSDDIGLLLWAPGGGDWGVDIERLRPMPDAESLARQVFTPQERDAWQAGPAHGRSREFLRLWTRKEACLKAIGSGLSIAPDSFSVGLAAPPSVAVVPLPDGFAAEVWVTDVSAGDDSVAAAAVLLPAGAQR